ncbi:RNB-domain-containing protein [Backusella circina FSU 941]|nr:RNB-domain-containing protein [Backusella circina FSU 941]KAI8879150.1 RNB-domain-containing protein [Backusella circina FSU 941]
MISVTSPQTTSDDIRCKLTDVPNRRSRRFSEPFHTTEGSKFSKHKHDGLQPINEYLNDETSENEKTSFVSHNHLIPTTHQKRTRSQSGKQKKSTLPIVSIFFFSHFHLVPDTLSPLQQQQQQQPERKPLYPVHQNDIDALAQIRAHKLFSGILRVDWQDSSDANVECEELDGESIYIYGSRNRNRALDGDEVAVELVDVDTMLKEKQAKKQARHTRRMSTSLSSIPEDTTAASIVKPKYCGKVVCILERPRNMLFSGTLSLQRPHAKNLDNSSREKKTTNPKIIWFIPADKRLPLVAVPIKHAPTDFIKHHGEYHNRIFVGNITRWPVTSLHPFGIIEKEIGWMGELDVHLGALMADHHLKDDEFADSLIKACDTVPVANDIQNRMDLCDLNTFTIGEDDFDTGHAFSISFPEKDIIEVGIHVPDVTKLIKKGNPLDREARERICAVKLVNKKIPILPSAFIESHFSLKPDKKRSTYSVMCRFTENGVLLHAWIGATLIKSTRHITFKQKQDGDLSKLLHLCQKLQHSRIQKGGSLSLARSNLEFDLSASGYPTSIHRADEVNEDTRVLLQEILIIANLEVGQKISSRFPDQALLVRQEEPKVSKLVRGGGFFLYF